MYLHVVSCVQFKLLTNFLPQLISDKDMRVTRVNVRYFTLFMNKLNDRRRRQDISISCTTSSFILM